LLSSEHEKSKGRDLDREKTRSIMDFDLNVDVEPGSLQVGIPTENDGLVSVDGSLEERPENKDKDR
jgi:hypothetical protein